MANKYEKILKLIKTQRMQIKITFKLSSFKNAPVVKC